MFGRIVGAHPGGRVDLPQAPGRAAHLVVAYQQILVIAALQWPSAQNGPGRLGLQIVEHPALAGQQEGHVGEVRLMGRVGHPAGLRVGLPGQPARLGIARQANAAASIGPKLAVIFGIQPGAIGLVPGMPGDGAGGLGLHQGDFRGPGILADQPGRVGCRGKADIRSPAGLRHVLGQAVGRHGRAPAGAAGHRRVAFQQAGGHLLAERVMRHRASLCQRLDIVLDVEPALPRVAQPLAAIVVVAAEALVIALVLALTEVSVEDRLAVHRHIKLA